jgi:hypothetical protein
MRGEVAIGEECIGGEDVLAWVDLDYWVLIGGVVEGQVLADSVNIEENGDGITRARCRVVNPTVAIAEGKRFEIIWRAEKVFAGLIRTMTIDADQAESALFYDIEADGWDSLLARHTVTASYANKTVGFILRDVITTKTALDTDGVVPGIMDEGSSLILCEADHVRASEFIRDVSGAGGGVAYLDPYKRLQFRPVTGDASDVEITNARAEKIQHIGDIDSYRNRQIVKVIGADGTTTVTETRDDLAQQAVRVTDEGGSGIYEAYESITHPTSSVSGELSILGQTVGYVQLRTYSRNARRVIVTMREPVPRLGQLVTLDLPGFTLSGQYVVMRKTWTEVAHSWVFELEFWESSFQKLALESLLRIVAAGKAAVSVSANVFPNVQLFSTVGAHIWVVPGGVTTAQFTCYGGSGGAGGYWKYATPIPFECNKIAYGGNGGNSGKAVTILGVVPAQVYDIVVGAKGVKGVFGDPGSPCSGASHLATAGTSGTNSSVSISAVTKCQGNGAVGGAQATGDTFHGYPGANGAHGGGIGDAVSVGGGQVGGSKNPLSDGLNGLVEVRW